MEEMDDFGELYADVEVHASSFQGLQEEEKKTSSEGFNPDTTYREVTCSGEESISTNRTCSSNGEKSEKVTISDSKLAASETEEDGSESEDDLHIVLNEEDCREGKVVRGSRVVVNGRMVEGSDGEEDELVIVSENNQATKDKKQGDVSHLMAVSGPERGASVKGSYLSQYSQFKYVRPHASAAQLNAKACGSSSSMSGRGDWDANGGWMQMASTSGATISSCSLDLPAVSRNGFDFFLPRNRTILDIGIENFERKPWRHPGVDITDFFNFGLDEESWKVYCKQMENFRRQATMLTRIPVYESSRPDQVDSAENFRDSIASKVVPSENCEMALVEDRENFSSAVEIINRGVRHLEAPKGRAIQVEDSIIERQPSMDVRRSRHRDSDVVIQIPVKDTLENSSVSSQEERDHLDDPSEKVFEKVGSKVENSRTRKELGSPSDQERNSRCSPPRAVCKDLDELHHLKWKGAVSGETTNADGTIRNFKDKKNLTSKFKAESPLSSPVQGDLNPSYIEPHHCKGSKHDRSKAKPKDSSNHNSQEKVSIPEKLNYVSRRKLYSVAEVKRPTNNAGGSPRAHKRSYYCDDQPSKYRCGTGSWEEKKSVYGFGDEIDPFYYRESEMSIAYHSRRLDERHINQTSFSKPLLGRKQNEREYSLKPWFGSEDDYEMRQREFYFHDREHDEWGAYKKSTSSISEKFYINAEKERHLWQQRRRENDRRQRYRLEEEFIQEKWRKHGTYSGREESIAEEYRRHVPYTDRIVQNLNQRGGSDESLHFGVDKDCRHSDHYGSLSSHIYKEFHFSHRRGGYGSSPPRDDEYDSWSPREEEYGSWGSHERYPTHRLESPNFQYIPSKNDRDGTWVGSCSKENWNFSSPSRGFDFDRDDWDDIVYSERRRYDRQSKPSNLIDGDLSVKHRGRDGSYESGKSFFYKRSFRNSYDSGHGGKVLYHQVGRDEKNTLIEQCTESELFKHEAALRSRESDDLQYNGWEGKYHSQRSYEAGDVTCHRRGETNHSINRWLPFKHSDEVNAGKVVPPETPKLESNHLRSSKSEVKRWDVCNSEQSSDHSKKKLHDKSPILRHHEVLDLEEGQLTEPEIDDMGLTSKNHILKSTARILVVGVTQVDNMEIKVHSGDGTGNNSKVTEAYDNSRIRETLAKMQKRRERFKEPIAPKLEPDMGIKSLAELPLETKEVKQQRPVRKRRWAGT